ncbi:MAG: STAS domain-containing protein, partial [Oscillochloris sp.]|nr:STAS domain-containing protein [Oscillochloris sp.]
SINPALETADTFLTGAASQRLQLSGRQLVVSRSTLVDTHGQRVGTLVLGRDVTEIEERTLQLEQERAHLASLVRELEAEQQERAALAATVQALAMPVIPILDGVLVLPLVGVFDRERMSELRILMLKAVERLSARIVMLDLTGLSFLDEIGAVGLTRSIQAARLLGAECMLVGVRPEIAEAIVAQGLVIEDIPTAATLQEAVRRVLVPTRNITL